jgi:multidrug efflux system membrane fusion protein
MTTRRILLALVCLVLVAGIVGYWAPWQPEQTQQQKRGFRKRGASAPRTEAVPVLVADTRAADVPVYLDGVGTAKALKTVTVKPQVDGKLLSVSFKEGQDVSKGYVLAKIDPTIYQAQYDQAVAKKAQDEALLANAKLDLARYSKLAQSNAINKQQVDTTRAQVAQLEAQVQSDQAAIDNARAILSYTNVTAPIAGRTGIRMVDEGNIVRASDSTGLVVITQIKPISVLFSLPQQVLPDLTKGMAEGPLPIDAFAPDGTTVVDKGKVLVINNQVDPTTGTVQLKAEFPNPDLQLWPGQFVNVRVLINTLHQVVVVPAAAVQRGPSGVFVYVVKGDQTVTVRKVSITQQDDQQAVIATGLTPGEQVVTTGFARLAEGTRVSTASAEAAGQITPKNELHKGRGKRGQRGTRRNGQQSSSGGTASTQP